MGRQGYIMLDNTDKGFPGYVYFLPNTCTIAYMPVFPGVSKAGIRENKV